MEDALQYLELDLSKASIHVTDLTNDTQDELEDVSQYLELALSKALIQ